jgi:hypothetical protein
VTFYDRIGNWSLRLQAQEHSDAVIRRTIEHGRRIHRDWPSRLIDTVAA